MLSEEQKIKFTSLREKINVIFNLGSWEGKLDFKTDLAKLKIDNTANSGFTSNKLEG